MSRVKIVEIKRTIMERLCILPAWDADIIAMQLGALEEAVREDEREREEPAECCGYCHKTHLKCDC